MDLEQLQGNYFTENWFGADIPEKPTQQAAATEQPVRKRDSSPKKTPTTPHITIVESTTSRKSSLGTTLGLLGLGRDKKPEKKELTPQNKPAHDSAGTAARRKPEIRLRACFQVVEILPFEFYLPLNQVHATIYLLQVFY